mmetsp:Transcript_8897/g.27616  ORF Transcript_8897/g.27616 Transcript_8897/m.27616 type:complete len:279 (-) Transcript_8897:280-1116(-)
MLAESLQQCGTNLHDAGCVIPAKHDVALIEKLVDARVMCNDVLDVRIRGSDDGPRLDLELLRRLQRTLRLGFVRDLGADRQTSFTREVGNTSAENTLHEPLGVAKNNERHLRLVANSVGPSSDENCASGRRCTDRVQPRRAVGSLNRCRALRKSPSGLFLRRSLRLRRGLLRLVIGGGVRHVGNQCGNLLVHFGFHHGEVGPFKCLHTLQLPQNGTGTLVERELQRLAVHFPELLSDDGRDLSTRHHDTDATGLIESRVADFTRCVCETNRSFDLGRR